MVVRRIRRTYRTSGVRLAMMFKYRE